MDRLLRPPKAVLRSQDAAIALELTFKRSRRVAMTEDVAIYVYRTVDGGGAPSSSGLCAHRREA